MRFCEFAKFMHENYEANANDSEFVSILIDAILDESALEKEGNPNPIYGLSANTRLAYYSGKRQIFTKESRADCSKSVRGIFRQLCERLFNGCP